MQVLIVHPPDCGPPVDTVRLVDGTEWVVETTADYRQGIAAAGGGNIDAIIVAAPDAGAIPLVTALSRLHLANCQNECCQNDNSLCRDD